MNTPSQEIPSTLFNNILRPNIKPLSVNELPKDVISEFNAIIDKGYGENSEIVKKRIYYLIPYILQAIDWDSYYTKLDSWQIAYYYQRERFINVTKLSEEKFNSHSPLQNALKELELDPVATFEFILFLDYYFYQQSTLKHSSVEQYKRLKEALSKEVSDDDAATVSMDVVVCGKHYKFGNSDFIRVLFSNIKDSEILNNRFSNDFSEGQQRYKLRELDYFLIKTLLNYLPIKRERRQGVAYSQAERNLGLSVLNLCGRLMGIDREGICSKENNATFDKLMRDFKSVRIPFAMELFL